MCVNQSEQCEIFNKIMIMLIVSDLFMQIKSPLRCYLIINAPVLVARYHIIFIRINIDQSLLFETKQEMNVKITK